MNEIVGNHGEMKVFEPCMDEAERERKIKGWQKAVRYCLGWSKDEED